jgi:hypothetical protein
VVPGAKVSVLYYGKNDVYYSKTCKAMGVWGIIAFVCLGAFIGIAINSAAKAKGKVLQQNFVSLGNLVGRPLAEIEGVVGPANALTACTTAEGKPGTLRTWAQNPYSITLIFDENLVCLGVNSEISM